MLRNEADPGTDLQMGPILPETIPIAPAVIPYGLVGGTDTSCRYKHANDNLDE